MVQARREVFDQGIFNPLADTISNLVAKLSEKVFNNLQKPKQMNGSMILDAGCGEGFYTASIAKETRELPCSITGIDISKWAIMAASKRYKNIPWAVANNKKLPVAKGDIEILTSIFGFETWQAWQEVQTLGQKVVRVKAAQTHLIELKSIIYKKIKQNINQQQNKEPLGYKLTDHQTFSYLTPQITTDVIKNILIMTPHGHRINQDAWKEVELLDSLALTIAVEISVFERQ